VAFSAHELRRLEVREQATHARRMLSGRGGELVLRLRTVSNEMGEHQIGEHRLAHRFELARGARPQRPANARDEDPQLLADGALLGGAWSHKGTLGGPLPRGKRSISKRFAEIDTRANSFAARPSRMIRRP